VLQLKVLVCELLGAVDGPRAGAISVDEISSLYHEPFDLWQLGCNLDSKSEAYDAMEFAALVALRLASIVLRLASAELSKILCSLWHDVLEQLHLDSPQLLSWLLMSVTHGRDAGPHHPEDHVKRAKKHERCGVRGRYAM
jgi:hypothetical protein